MELKLYPHEFVLHQWNMEGSNPLSIFKDQVEAHFLPSNLPAKFPPVFNQNIVMNTPKVIRAVHNLVERYVSQYPVGPTATATHKSNWYEYRMREEDYSPVRPVHMPLSPLSPPVSCDVVTSKLCVPGATKNSCMLLKMKVWEQDGSLHVLIQPVLSYVNSALADPVQTKQLLLTALNHAFAILKD